MCSILKPSVPRLNFVGYSVFTVVCLLLREELEKQEARRRYQQMHLAGKTDEAQADLARLAIIRKQREEAARKKEEERKGKYLCIQY